jgi:hypothetical protein
MFLCLIFLRKEYILIVTVIVIQTILKDVYRADDLRVFPDTQMTNQPISGKINSFLKNSQ